MSYYVPASVLGGQAQVLQRTPPAEGDKYTIVSIFPKAIHEEKITLDPGVFDIAPGSLEKPATLTVGSSVWWKGVGPDSEPAEITVPSILVAHSVIMDYCNSLLGAKPNEIYPGLFAVKGEHDSAAIVKNNQKELKAADVRQKLWYEALVKGADSLWARTNGNPIAIPDDARLAAQGLGLINKPWMQDFSTLQMVACVNCGNLRNPAYPSCPSCRVVVDKALFAKLGLTEGTK